MRPIATDTADFPQLRREGKIYVDKTAYLSPFASSYTYWQDPKDGMFVGYWNEYPDYVTQGHDLPELQFMLRDIRDAIRDGDLQDTRRSVGVMEFA